MSVTNEAAIQAAITAEAMSTDARTISQAARVILNCDTCDEFRKTMAETRLWKDSIAHVAAEHGSDPHALSVSYLYAYHMRDHVQ